MKAKTLGDWIKPLPLVAILRGVKPEEVVAIGEVLIENGFGVIEVPLNSPQPFASIDKLAKRFGDKALIGAGTVTDWTMVSQVADSGGKIIVMPHSDERVVEAAKRGGLFALPGFSTPTEAFRMIEAGADALKVFPAEASPPNVIKAMRAILPNEIALLPVGGITPQRLADYWAAGANGFGLGSALYKPGSTPEQVSQNATEFRKAFRALGEN